jgi:hypothetical protein
MDDLQNDTKIAGGTNFGVALVVMFVVGLLAGYSLRPLINGNEAVTSAEKIVEVTVVVTATPGAIANAPDVADEPGEIDENGKTVIVVTATPTPTPDYMKDLLAKARHSQGDETAPVKMIEFSDFK